MGKKMQQCTRVMTRVMKHAEEQKALQEYQKVVTKEAKEIRK
jgi:hypothetical protein